ncbi:MAG: ABC transporter permease, partial [Oscillospiraceae bacterium]|nr:ABC transporter permease [Oscillospiraceae bacterium]
MTGKLQDLLSHSYYSYAVPDGADVGTLLNLAERYRNSGTLILRYKENGTCGVYAAGREFTPKMSSGRSFLESDFQSHSKTAIISDTSTDQLKKIDGRSCILIDNKYFEVIGTFSRSDNIVNRDANVYYNLSAYKTEKTVKLRGQYALDAGTDSAQLAADFQNAFQADSIHTPEDLSFKNRLHTAIFNQAITIMPLILVVLMILLNSINVTLNWIDKRKNELITRRICGATTSALMLHLSRDYILLVTISYVFGFAVVAVASHFILIYQLSLEYFTQIWYNRDMEKELRANARKADAETQYEIRKAIIRML